MKKIGILGSTGSIGTQALELIDDINFKISYLSAYSNVDLLIAQTNKFKPESICIVDESKISLLKKKLNTSKIEILSGIAGLQELASRNNIDLLLNALVGYSGMLPTLTAIQSGVDVALANKESLVVGGEIIKNAMYKTKAKLFPVDSEHSAIWQCLLGRGRPW